MALINFSFITKQLVVHKLCYYFYLDTALLSTHWNSFLKHFVQKKQICQWSRRSETDETYLLIYDNEIFVLELYLLQW